MTELTDIDNTIDNAHQSMLSLRASHVFSMDAWYYSSKRRRQKKIKACSMTLFSVPVGGEIHCSPSFIILMSTS